MKQTVTNLPTCCEHEIHSDAVARARGTMPDDATVYDLSDFFKLLGDPTRLRILFAVGKRYSLGKRVAVG